MSHHEGHVYPLPKPAELVAFEHGAAGHPGMSSDVSGTLIIKPCTQAEIDFYEASALHPDFRALMPAYMGQLRLVDEKDGITIAPSIGEGTTVPVTDVPMGTGEATATPPIESHSTVEKSKEKRQSKVWVPSGGKKLQTNLGIALENAAASFKRPNVIDLKLGSRLWADDAPEEKRRKLDQVSAETTSGSLGFRIAGAKLWLGNRAADADVEVNTEIKDGYKSFNKNYGRSLDERSVEQALAKFISGAKAPGTYGSDKSRLGSKEARILTRKLIWELEHMQSVIEAEESRMYSASVLVIIEGDYKALQEAMAAEEERMKEYSKKESLKQTDQEEIEEDRDDDDDAESDESEHEPKVMEVRLIDFAHAAFTPGQGPDENALKGIRSIISILKEISN